VTATAKTNIPISHTFSIQRPLAAPALVLSALAALDKIESHTSSQQHYSIVGADLSTRELVFNAVELANESIRDQFAH
jgi:hypothetical protein